MLFLSNRPHVSSDGIEIFNNDSEYKIAVDKAKDLVEKPLERYDSGETLTAAELSALEEGAKLYEAANRFRPTDVMPYFMAGKTYQALGENEVAEERSRQAIYNGQASLESMRSTGDPKQISAIQLTLADAHYIRSMALFGMKDFDGARDEADQATRMNPNAPAYHVAAARAYLELRQLPTASAEIKIALSLDPNNKLAKQLAKLINSSD